MKKPNIKKFDEAYRQFLEEKDTRLHHRAVETLLTQIGLNEEFVLCVEGEIVKSFFFLWEQAGREEEDPKERVGLKQLGKLSKGLYRKESYQELCELFYDMALRHLASFLRLEERTDFKKLTDHDLYIKKLIPPEIFLQFFLIETLVKRTDFDWNRGEVIAHQNLACLIVCWGDIYDFFHEQEEEENEELEEQTEKLQKVGRNDPCPCGKKKEDGSPVKYKKCHGA